MELTFEKFSQANKDRCESPEGFNHKVDGWSEAEWLAAATGELGEVAHAVKAILRKRDNLIANPKSDDELKSMLAEEIADTIIYLDLLAQRSGVFIGDAIREKFNTMSDKIGSSVKL